MTTAAERLKSEVSLLEHVQKRLGQNGKKEIAGVRFKSHKDDNDPSLLVYSDVTRGYHDYSDRLKGGTIIDFEMNYQGIELKDALKFLSDSYNIHDEKKEFKKAPKRFELVEKFEEHRQTGGNKTFARFLSSRGVDFDLIAKYKNTLNDIAREIGLVEGLWVEDKTYKDCLIFPCLDENSKVVGAKLRRVDGEQIKFFDKYVKSIGVGKPEGYAGPIPFSTGLLYKKEDLKKDILIVEGETDYMILKMLGFSSVIGNLGGVSSNADSIQALAKHSDKIICLYDNDAAGQKATLSLQEKIGKPIRSVTYPKIDGLDKYDINDLFKQGWRESDFQDLINKSSILQEEDLIPNPITARFVYLDFHLSFYDVKARRMVDKNKISDHLLLKPKEVLEMRGEEINEYEDLCYRDGGKPGHFNTLDKKVFSTPSSNPELHPHIEKLINNLCNHKQENIEYIHKAILYKYHHLNDVLLPAVVFYGPGGSGKGTFLKLLGKIFGQDNMQEGLGQRDLESDYTSYNGEKLVVEFREINTGSKFKDKKMLDNIKSFVGESRISINPKYDKKREVDNIAWFILSSNHTVPIQLDSMQNGNRRFSIIQTGAGIGIAEGKTINASIKDKKIISDYLAWLNHTYPEVKDMTSMAPLDNQEKRNLELLCESVGNLFFTWVEEKYPTIYKISNAERDVLLDLYKFEISDNEFGDSRYKITNFNSGLSHKYSPTKVNIRGKITQGYFINKTDEEKVLIKRTNPDGIFGGEIILPKTHEQIAEEKKDKVPF